MLRDHPRSPPTRLRVVAVIVTTFLISLIRLIRRVSRAAATFAPRTGFPTLVAGALEALFARDGLVHRDFTALLAPEDPTLVGFVVDADVVG